MEVMTLIRQPQVTSDFRQSAELALRTCRGRPAPRPCVPVGRLHPAGRRGPAGECQADSSGPDEEAAAVFVPGAQPAPEPQPPSRRLARCGTACAGRCWESSCPLPPRLPSAPAAAS